MNKKHDYDEPKERQPRPTHCADPGWFKYWERQAVERGLNEDDGYDVMRDEMGPRYD